MSSDRRCGVCRTNPARPGYHVCESCRPNIPVRKPIEDTLALIDATLAGADLPGVNL